MGQRSGHNLKFALRRLELRFAQYQGFTPGSSSATSTSRRTRRAVEYIGHIKNNTSKYPLTPPPKREKSFSEHKSNFQRIYEPAGGKTLVLYLTFSACLSPYETVIYCISDRMYDSNKVTIQLQRASDGEAFLFSPLFLISPPCHAPYLAML